MTAILGINCYKHDAAAALLLDGQLVAAADEERFRRIKHYSGYPEKAIEYVLAEASITSDQIDHIAFYMLPSLIMRENIIGSIKRPVIEGHLINGCSCLIVCASIEYQIPNGYWRS